MRAVTQHCIVRVALRITRFGCQCFFPTHFFGAQRIALDSTYRVLRTYNKIEGKKRDTHLAQVVRTSMLHFDVREVLEGNGLGNERKHPGNHGLRCDHRCDGREHELGPKEGLGHAKVEQGADVLGLTQEMRRLPNVIEEKRREYAAEPGDLCVSKIN
jgi:hypothetical protein